MKYSHHQTKYIGKQVGLRTYQHPGTLIHLFNIASSKDTIGLYCWPYHFLAGQSTASHRRDPSSIQVQSLWNVWWTKWYGGQVFLLRVPRSSAVSIIPLVFHNHNLVGRDSSVGQQLDTDWTVLGSNHGGGKIFRTRPGPSLGPTRPPTQCEPGLFQGEAAGAWR